MEYRMKDIMEPPKTLEEQKKEAREAAMAAGAEVLGEEWKPGTLENVKRQVENAYTDLKGCGLYKEEKHFRNGMDLMYNNVIDIMIHTIRRRNPHTPHPPSQRGPGWTPLLPQSQKAAGSCLSERLDWR